MVEAMTCIGSQDLSRFVVGLSTGFRSWHLGTTGRRQQHITRIWPDKKSLRRLTAAPGSGIPLFFRNQTKIVRFLGKPSAPSHRHCEVMDHRQGTIRRDATARSSKNIGVLHSIWQCYCRAREQLENVCGTTP